MGEIAWSYELLSADHRERLACLSVFAGGFTADAALIVARATAADLEELRRRSLVTDGDRGAILETIREYSLARLGGLDRADEARLRHAGWALSLAEEADDAIREGSEPGVWLDRLEEEHGNLRAALDWSSSAQPRMALALAVALGSFWEFRGHIAEGDEQLARALRGAPEADASLRARGYLRSGVFARTRRSRRVGLSAREITRDRSQHR